MFELAVRFENSCQHCMLMQHVSDVQVVGQATLVLDLHTEPTRQHALSSFDLVLLHLVWLVLYFCGHGRWYHR